MATQIGMRNITKNTPLLQRYPIIRQLYDAKTHVIDLGERAVEEILVQPKMFTNAGYTVGLLVSDAASTDIGTALNAAITGSAFGNQPNDDALQVLSDTAEDVGRVVTVYGTITGTSIVKKEQITLDASDGTTPVTSTIGNWGYILGVEVDSAHATATITIREDSGDQTVTTIAATETSAGVTSVATSLQNMHGLPAQAVASDTSVKIVGVVGEDSVGNEVLDAITLSNTTAVNGVYGMAKVTKLLTGDVEGTRTATVKIGNVGLGACQYNLASGGAFDAGLGRRMILGGRYLHVVVLNGTTPTAGGVADVLYITPIR
jgi:hypothetical protein